MTKFSILILGSISLVVKQYVEQYQKEDLSKTLIQLEPDLGLPRIQTYDFIIVGAGTAGCLVAGRLSQFFTVLLLETGGNPPPAMNNQFWIMPLISDPLVNYQLSSHSKYFSLETGGIANVSQGRMMGGSGSHNHNVYNRGSPRDYEQIVKITGDPSWSYENVLPHFKRFENFHGILLNESQRTGLFGFLPEFYNDKGPISVTTEISPMLTLWLEAARELGYRYGDPNGYRLESFTPLAKSMRNGEKSSAYREFIEKKEKSNRNLRVLRYSQVQKILIDENKVAYGVTYLRHGIPQIAHANREVILSAGPLLSPLMLIKSGIGPVSVLDAADIPCIQDIPAVGKNLGDHSNVFLKFKVNNFQAAHALNLFQSEAAVEVDLVKFQSTTRSGYFTNIFAQQAFLVSERAKRDGEFDWPDMHLIINSMPPFLNNSAQVLFLVAVARPKSRGLVELNIGAYKRGSLDDQELAQIDYGAFTDSSDMDVIIEAITHVFRIAETRPFKELGLEYVPDIPEACKFLQPGSDEYWRCYVTHKTGTYWHFSGTCTMGRWDDPNAVVDTESRVRGVSKLRVVDSSALPISTSSNSNAPTLVLAEKASCGILREYLLPNSNNFNVCPLDLIQYAQE